MNNQTHEDDKFVYYTCKEKFSTQNLMMMHRKTNHIKKQCREFLKENCKIGDDRCWYMQTNQDFSQARQIRDPPI